MATGLGNAAMRGSLSDMNRIRPHSTADNRNKLGNHLDCGGKRKEHPTGPYLSLQPHTDHAQEAPADTQQETDGPKQTLTAATAPTKERPTTPTSLFADDLDQGTRPAEWSAMSRQQME